MELTVRQIESQPFIPFFSYKEQITDVDETDSLEVDETDSLEIEYPETDGKPMGETEIHVMAIMQLYQSLLHFFKDQNDVSVIADMLFYYKKGDPKTFRVPDVMVIKGIPKRLRRVYKLWEEKVPSVIVEITSKSTAAEDIAKSMLYASLGVQEYYLFDPLQEYLPKTFCGFCLDESLYIPIPPESDGSIFSKELGLKLKRENHLIRLIDPKTGKTIPTFEEESRRAEDADRRAKEADRIAKEEAKKAEEANRRAAEAAKESARLASKLRELGIDPESF